MILVFLIAATAVFLFGGVTWSSSGSLNRVVRFALIVLALMGAVAIAQRYQEKRIAEVRTGQQK